MYYLLTITQADLQFTRVTDEKFTRLKACFWNYEESSEEEWQCRGLISLYNQTSFESVKLIFGAFQSILQIACCLVPWLPLQWRHNDHDVRLKSPASRLFTQPFIQTQIKENIKAPRHWPLCGEFTGTGEFPAQRASYAENVSIWWRHHDPAAC